MGFECHAIVVLHSSDLVAILPIKFQSIPAKHFCAKLAGNLMDFTDEHVIGFMVRNFTDRNFMSKFHGFFR